MNLKDYLSEDRIVVLQGSTKSQILAELAEKIAHDGAVESQDLITAIEQREKLMSTGIGHGLAVPHVRLKGLHKLTVAVGVKSEGIKDYTSIDDKPVKIVVLIAAPAGQHEAYIKVLASVVESLKQEKIREKIADLKNPSEIYGILTS